MPKQMTQEDVKKRLYQNYGDKYTLISNYKTKRDFITLHCNIHNTDWTIIAENALRTDRPTSCPKCTKEKHSVPRTRTIEVECSYCGEKILKTPIEIEQSKNKIFFCCRAHKDLAQQIDFGLKEIWPDHYDNGNFTYREKAIRTYGAKCSSCGYDLKSNLIDIHHIDGNRENNSIENLIPLCVMCHAKITRGLARIENRQVVDIN